jgi:hypothetical protein
MAIAFSLDMSLSREEFLRLLPAAVGPAAVEEKDGLFVGGDEPQRWTLRLVPLDDRHLGSVILPCHRVEIRLDGYSDVAAEAFLARFHRGFQRGGG